MDRRQISSLLVLKELGITPSLRTFDNRLLVQKAIYLAQAAGFDLGYYFGWYLRGPYCSSVAQDLFSAIEDPEDSKRTTAKWSLDSGSQADLAPLRELVCRPFGRAPSSNRVDEAQQARWLELLASVHYLIERKQVSTHGAKEIAKQLRAFNKNFDESEVQQALKELRARSILRTPAN